MPKHERRRGVMEKGGHKPNRPPPQRDIVPEFERITELQLDRIVPNPDQPRKDLGNGAKIDELARSIQQEGLIQPIIVRKKMNNYEIVVGERRWRACKMVGLDKIPAIVRDVNDHHILLQSLIENLHRKDLASTEREDAVYELWTSGNYKTQKGLADGLSYSKSTVNEIIEAKEYRDRSGSAAELSTKLISQTKAIDDDDLRTKVIEKIQEEKVPSHEVRQFVREIQKAPRHKREEMVKPSFKINGKNKIIMDRVRRLEKSIDEFVAVEDKKLISLTMEQKEQIKAKLGSMAEKLDEVMKKIDMQR